LTIVAAWMRAETGVGPSIASGSQTWKGNWADLPAAPTKSSRMTMSMIHHSVSDQGRSSNDRRTFMVPVSRNTPMMPTRKP
jgi:hypothetical protein